MSESCQYRHICLRCGARHTEKDCTKEHEGGKLTLRNLTPSVTSTETAPPLPYIPTSELLPSPANDTILSCPDLFRIVIVTPINVDHFEQLLMYHPNPALVHSVYINPDDPITFDFSKRKLDEAGAVFLREQRDVKIKAGRYSESFGHELLPGMYSLPIGAVIKPHTTKFCLVNNHSAGPHSLNSWISKEDSHIRMDNLQDFGAILMNARKKYGHPPAYLWKSYVAAAYRRMPAAFQWQIKQISTIDGQRHVDCNLVFGSCMSAQIWCTFMGLVIWICIFTMLIADILHYMDNAWSYDMNPELVYYELYDTSYPSKQVALLRLWDEIGLPHSKNKQEFRSSLIIIGFHVDPQAMSFTMPTESKTALISAICAFIDTSLGQRKPLIEWQHLLGWINWALNVFPLLKPALQSSYTKITGKRYTHAPIFLNRSVIQDLCWLANVIEESEGIYFFDALEWPLENANMEVFCDSTLTNIAFYIPQANLGYCAPVLMNTPQGTMYFLEALAVISAIAWAAEQRQPPCRLLIHSDSLNSVEMFHSLKAGTGYNTLLLYAVRILMNSEISLCVAHIHGYRDR
ncbi:hypothetical protein K439DRAFT_1646686 [Ramaria rubella]|nr:hypothetical protein K439DRAFT_1646686 [Ramaria rubella]